MRGGLAGTRREERIRALMYRPSASCDIVVIERDAPGRSWWRWRSPFPVVSSRREAAVTGGEDRRVCVIAVSTYFLYYAHYDMES